MNYYRIMLIARRKRKENIVEYILYHYQVEDLIRAFNMDMELIRQKLIPSYKADHETILEIESWYENLFDMMIRENIEASGHLQFLKNLVSELEEFHLKLLDTGIGSSYVATYQSTAGIIKELQHKNTIASGDVQAALDGVYGYLLLKIQNKQITSETEIAIKQISNWLGRLAKLYRDFEAGDLEF